MVPGLWKPRILEKILEEEWKRSKKSRKKDKYDNTNKD